MKLIFESLAAVEAFERAGKAVRKSARGKRAKVGESSGRSRVAIAERGSVRRVAVAEAVRRVAAMEPAKVDLAAMSDTEFRAHASRTFGASVAAGSHAIAGAYWQSTTAGETLAQPLSTFLGAPRAEA